MNQVCWGDYIGFKNKIKDHKNLSNLYELDKINIDKKYYNDIETCKNNMTELKQKIVNIDAELKSYNEMMNEARAIATKRMVEQAEQLGADAVVNIRYASSAIMQGAAEVIAYGTAVKFI